MKNKYLYCLLPVFAFWALASALFAHNAQAQVTINNDRISVTGIVSDVKIDSFTVQTGLSQFRINTDELNLPNDLDDLITEGLEVVVIGDLDERAFRGPTIEADQIRILGRYEAPEPNIIILEDDSLG